MEKRDQQRVFNQLVSSEFEGVRGVIYLKGEKSGPVVGITICTHGNEPAGLAAADFLLTHFENHSLESGELYLVLNNIEATRSYVSASSEEEKAKARYVDINLNRLPENVFENRDETRYEILRARELMPIWKRFTIGLDIHSTSQDAEPMLISIGESLRLEHIHGFPIQKLITNIDAVMKDYGVSEFFGDGTGEAYGIECGGHEVETSFSRAILCTKKLLQNLEMLPQDSTLSSQTFEEYIVRDAIFFPNDSYVLTRIFKNFEEVPAGTVLAQGSEGDIAVRVKSHTLFAPNTVRPIHKGEEILFLTEPMRIRELQ